MYNTTDILNIFKEKYKNQDFRIIGNNVQQSKTIEIQNAQFECDKDWIVREPNYEYFEREKEWYLSQSLNINDIPGGAPTMWKACCDNDGFINSNYGWCIFSKENYEQYNHCLEALTKDPSSRAAIMLYTRPSIQIEALKNGMHDFICTYGVQCFLNPKEDGYELRYIVIMRSNDAVFGFNSDHLWAKYVYNKLCDDLEKNLKCKIYKRNIEWVAMSLHIYERHFKYLQD